jgi:lipopolysaccharide export system protein LptA
MMRDRAASTRLFAVVMVAAVLAGAAAVAQQGPPNALQGFSTNRDKPVKIDAATLEVRDKEKVATFSGDVHVVQGDTDMRCKVLVVYYEESAAKAGGPKTADPGPAGSSQIRRMEARGNVVVTQKEQTATGDRGDFDMRTNTVTLSGKVVVTKGQDVLRGERLVVNLTDGVSRMEGGRVEGMFNPKSNSEQKNSEQKSASGLPALPTPARKK